MNERGIPWRVEVFVLKNIHSVEQLEVLLFLRKESGRAWSAESIGAAINTNSPSASVADRLTNLCTRRLAVKSQDADKAVYRYESTPETMVVVDDLMKFYGTHKQVIIELIYSRPAETISFAEAFRVRKKDD